MGDQLDQTPGARPRGEPEGLIRPRDADDVEGHAMLRREGDGVAARDTGAEGAAARGGDAAEGFARAGAVPDDGDDVEGHVMLRGEDGALLRGERGIARDVGPGEGVARRD